MTNKGIVYMDTDSIIKNKGGKKHLTEEEYYWIKSHMSSLYGMTKASNEELKNKFNEIYGKNGGNNYWK